MKLLIFSIVLIGCYTPTPPVPIILPDGKHAIQLDCEIPAWKNGSRLCECEEKANSLCPFGFNIIRIQGYTSFEPGPGPEIWGRNTRKTHHEVLTISCLPLPNTLEQP